MKFDVNRAPWLLILPLLAGLGIGLAYSWLISPVKYVDANPSILRTDFKDQYRAVIAAAYASSHDLDRARARLALLGDPNPVQALSAQAQQMLATGDSLESMRVVAQLASDLQQGNVTTPPTSTSIANIIPIPTIQSQPVNATPSSEETTIPTNTFDTPIVFITPTPQPTHTPIPPPGTPFTLVGQDTICDTNLQEGLLQVILMDAHRRQVPGMQIIVTWNGGEDRFFTGFKPELGNGYADFKMTVGTVYSVRLVESGAPIPNISIPTCTDSNGQSFPGGILLTFQQP